MTQAKKIASFILAKKAEDVIILDVKKISNVCDYYVICSGQSSTQVKAIYEDAVRKSKKENIRVQHAEVDSTCRWILLDYADVILHIFSKEAREFYNLEYLWKRAKKISPPSL